MNLINDKDLLESYFLDCQCALFLVDITSKESFDLIKNILEKLEIFFPKDKNEKKFTFRKIIIFNKIDLESERKISRDEISNFLNINPTIDSIDVSLKTLKGIMELTKLLLISYEKIIENQIPTDYIYEKVNNLRTNENERNQITATINLILLGESESGKTCFLNRYYHNKFTQNFLTTIGIDKGTKIFKIKDKIYRLTLWDTAGQERFKSIPQKYYQNADGALLLFDTSKRNTFESVDIWVEDIKKSTKLSLGEKVFLIGNKIDLKREVEKEEAIKKANDYGFKYFEISCKINMNITEVMAKMIYKCYKNLNKDENMSIKIYKKNLKKRKKKKCC